MDLAPDFDEFIGSLIAQEVEFLVVGAYALAFHGAPRYTGDIDILIRPTVENARRCPAGVQLARVSSLLEEKGFVTVITSHRDSEKTGYL
jgi:hypothetical protein